MIALRLPTRRPSCRVGLLFTLMAVLEAGCSVESTPTPSLTGPSTLSIAVTLVAVPSTVTRNGSDRSLVSAKVTDPDGQPLAVTLRAEVEQLGQVGEVGTISPATVRTNAASGVAEFLYVAPPPRALATEQVITVSIRVEDGDYAGSTPRKVAINVVPGPEAAPRSEPPAPDFAISPVAPVTATPVTFDAAATRSGDSACGVVCRYDWDFGDGAVGTGLTATHEYVNPGTYSVKLTVTDARGGMTSVSRSLTVGAATQPTAVFRFSPTPVGPNQDVYFVASESRAATGRRLTGYQWNFGDGTTGEGETVTHRFRQTGTFAVILTVTDSLRATAAATQSITVTTAGAGPTAGLSFSPQSPRAATSVYFDARGSVAGTAPITAYHFSYGDGTPDEVGASPTQSHVFASAGTYVVRVIVSDSLGRTGTTTASVTVVP